VPSTEAGAQASRVRRGVSALRQELKRHVWAGVCPAPLQPSAWILQIATSLHAPTNSAVHSENTYNLQYPRYSAIHSD